jgi:hypothetical protein
MTRRNWLLKTALLVMSAALALFGVLGWADKARALEALAARDWAILDALWPLYAVAAIGCIAAQVIAACAAVNFAWLDGASRIWRALAIAFYGVCVVFAAASADMGAQAVLASGQRAAYEAREIERATLMAEIAALSQAIEAERAKLPTDTANVPTSRQQAALDLFNAATAAARVRLPEAQRQLSERPPLARDPHHHWTLALAVFAIFLAWAILEPWGYALAERGREMARTVARATPANDSATPSATGAKVHWLNRLVALLTLGMLSQFGAPVATAQPAAATVAPPAPAPEPAPLAQWQDAKSAAFSMRGRFDVSEIAERVKRHPSTIYKWFRERDRQNAKAA